MQTGCNAGAGQARSGRGREHEKFTPGLLLIYTRFTPGEEREKAGREAGVERGRRCRPALGKYTHLYTWFAPDLHLIYTWRGKYTHPKTWRIPVLTSARDSNDGIADFFLAIKLMREHS